MASNPVKREVATLVVIVVRAQHLTDPHKLSKQDPYCICELSNSTQGQTKVDRGGGQTPVWDEELRFTVYEVEGEQQKLKITVMRQEHKQESEVVGEAYVAIDGKWKDNEFDEWVEIKQDGKYKGEVFLEMTYYPAMLPAVPLQRRPSKLDPAARVARGPMILPLPADNPSGRFVPAPRPRVQQALAQGQIDGSASRPAPNGRPPVPGKSVKAQAFVAGANPPALTRKPLALPLPGDPEPPEIPAFLRPGRQGVGKPTLEATSEENEGGAALQMQSEQFQQRIPPSEHQQKHYPVQGGPLHRHQQQPQYAPHTTAQPFAEQARPPPYVIPGQVQHQSDPQILTQQLRLDAQPDPRRQQAHSMPQPATSPALPPPHQQAPPPPSHQQQSHAAQVHSEQYDEQQPQWQQQQQQQQGERRWSGPPSQPSKVAHEGMAPLGWITGAPGATATFTQVPQVYQPEHWAQSTQSQPPPTPQIQVQTTGATLPANIPHHPSSPVHVPPQQQQQQQHVAYRPPPSPSPAPLQAPTWAPAQPAAPPSTQPYGQGPYPATVVSSHAAPYQPSPTPSPQFQPQYGSAPPLQHHSQSPPVVSQQTQHAPAPKPAPQAPCRHSTAQLQQYEPPVHPATGPRRSSSLDYSDSIPLPGAFKSAAAPPLPPKTPLAPPLPPPPPPARSPSPQPPPTPPRRLRADTPPRVASPSVPAGRTKLEEFEREQQAERERRRVERRERAQALGRENNGGDEEDRFDDAEPPPPMYSVKPTAAEKGKGPAMVSTGDSKRTSAAASTSSVSATASSSSSANPSSSATSASRIHAGQAALAQRIQQEREDARMAAALARENERREAERSEREKKADEEFARMMREEERLQAEREAREREDEELAKKMAEEGVGEEEARRRREEQDEELARTLAEAA